MAEITLPPLDINKTATEISNALKDGAYVAIGLGVLGFQRVQVQRVELIRQLEGWLGQLSELPTTWNSQVEDYAETARVRAETSRTELAGQLSELSHRVEEVLAPARARLAKAVPGELPNFPDLGRQLLDTQPGHGGPARDAAYPTDPAGQGPRRTGPARAPAARRAVRPRRAVPARQRRGTWCRRCGPRRRSPSSGCATPSASTDTPEMCLRRPATASPSLGHSSWAQSRCRARPNSLDETRPT